MMFSSPSCWAKVEHPRWLALGAHCWQGLTVAFVLNACMDHTSTSMLQPASWRMLPNSKHQEGSKAPSEVSTVFLIHVQLSKEPRRAQSQDKGTQAQTEFPLS